MYDYRQSPYGVEWIRFGPRSTSPDLVKNVAHVAFEVDDLEAALAGKDVIIPPSSPSEGVRVAFISDQGAPVELMQYDRSDDVARTILGLERGALDRWIHGDPGGFIDLAATDIVYFDPFQPRRVTGREAFVALMESIRGQVSADRYELMDPIVQAAGDFALLTFNYCSWPDRPGSRWNASEVYRRDRADWRLIQQHWSVTEAGKR